MSADSFLKRISKLCHPGSLPEGWRVHTVSKKWIQVVPSSASIPQQGWKLHVSAGLSSAGQILSRVLPVLLSEEATFKVAFSPEVLEELNEGRGALIRSASSDDIPTR